MEKYIVMESAFRNKSSWKWQHPRKRVAVVETDGVNMPKQIHPNHKAVRRIVETWECLYVGGPRSQYARAIDAAERLCDELNQKS